MVRYVGTAPIAVLLQLGNGQIALAGWPNDWNRRPAALTLVQMPSEITVERDGPVAVITLGAPRRRNALTVSMAEELCAACDEIDADPSVGAVVVAAEGPYFCAGADRALLAAAGEDPAAPQNYGDLGRVYAAFSRVGALEPPSIAAVCGGAVGAGLNLALATDLRVVSEDATLTSGFLPIGLHPGGGHGALLGRATNRETANAMQLFGISLSGLEAVEAGLAWTAVPADAVVPTAIDLATAPAADPDLARRTAASVRLVVGPPPLTWAAALHVERPAQMWSLRRRNLVS